MNKRYLHLLGPNNSRMKNKISMRKIVVFVPLKSFGKVVLFIAALGIVCSFKKPVAITSWIRINQLGYTPQGIKVAVWVSKDNELPKDFQLVESGSSRVVFTAATGKSFGSYGPFTQSFRLNFSSYKNPGNYHLKCGSAISPEFSIAPDVYAGTADFGLRYMRQQRSGFNPFLQDSCHTHDGYTMYGPMPDSTRLNVWGGWHDATDYLQYVTTSANATYHFVSCVSRFPRCI